MSKDLKDIKFKHGETPTPMRMMEDPTLWHVLPSRQSQSKKEKDMAPPPSKRKKIVLEEEEYVEYNYSMFWSSAALFFLGVLLVAFFLPCIPKVGRYEGKLFHMPFELSPP